jgi:hypothetical protein
METSPGKNTFFRLIAATSTFLGLLPAGFDTFPMNRSGQARVKKVVVR